MDSVWAVRIKFVSLAELLMILQAAATDIFILYARLICIIGWLTIPKLAETMLIFALINCSPHSLKLYIIYLNIFNIAEMFKITFLACIC